MAVKFTRKLNYIGEHRFSGNGRRWWRYGGGMPNTELGEHVSRPSWWYRESFCECEGGEAVMDNFDRASLGPEWNTDGQ